MTAERKAELRRLAEAAYLAAEPYAGEWSIEEGHARSSATRAYQTAACNAIPELLDELEAWQTEAMRATNAAEFGTKNWERVAAERNSLATQVVVLARQLDLAITRIELFMGRMMACDCHERHGSHQLSLEEGADFIVEHRAALADTEAAATAWLEAHDREQQLKGARELYKRYWANSTGKPYLLEGLLIEMEREARQ